MIMLPPEFRNREVIISVDESRHHAVEDGFDNQKERQSAFEDFMTSWKGCLKGVPHMTAKEIRAERLEKKYGQYRKEGGEE